MRLNYIEIENYKSFLTNQKIELVSGFNIFLGANNSGKTTALEVMDLKNINEPHKSIRNLPKYGDLPKGASLLKASITTNLEELIKFNGISRIPLPFTLSETDEEQRNFFKTIISNAQFDLLIESSNKIILTFKYSEGLSPQFLSSQTSEYSAFQLESSGMEIQYAPPLTYGDGHLLVPYYTKYIPYIYRFQADRRPASIFGTSDRILNRDASNLPYCINWLQSNDAHGHKILCERITKVFPNVRWVQAVPIPGNNTFELRCYPCLLKLDVMI